MKLYIEEIHHSLECPKNYDIDYSITIFNSQILNSKILEIQSFLYFSKKDFIFVLEIKDNNYVVINKTPHRLSFNSPLYYTLYKISFYKLKYDNLQIEDVPNIISDFSHKDTIKFIYLNDHIETLIICDILNTNKLNTHKILQTKCKWLVNNIHCASLCIDYTNNCETIFLWIDETHKNILMKVYDYLEIHYRDYYLDYVLTTYIDKIENYDHILD